MTWLFIAMVMGFLWWGPAKWSRSRGRVRIQGVAGTLELPDEVRVRLEAVDHLENRVAELESRLDFTERLLAERRSAELDSPSR